jgi:hypothetical protein
VDNKFKYSGWAMFYGEAANFSKSFRDQMSEQLYQKFYYMLGIEDKNKELAFRLEIWSKDLEMIIEDEYAFGLVWIVSPTSFAKKITAYWRTANRDNLLNAVNDSFLTSSTIEFGWCSDFDKDYFLEFLKPKKRLSKKKNNLNFTVEYDYTHYPDLSLEFYFRKKIDEKDLSIIKGVLSQHISNAYVSEITNEEVLDAYIGIIDFQDTPYENGILELLTAFQELSKLEISSSIRKISIE